MQRKCLGILGTLVLALGGVLGGCGSEPPPEVPRQSAEERAPARRDSTFGDMAETLERARGVEQLQQNRVGELDAALEGADGR